MACTCVSVPSCGVAEGGFTYVTRWRWSGGVKCLISLRTPRFANLSLFPEEGRKMCRTVWLRVVAHPRPSLALAGRNLWVRLVVRLVPAGRWAPVEPRSLLPVIMPTSMPFMGAILLSLAYEFGHIAPASSDSYRSRDSGRAYMGITLFIASF